VEIILCHTEFQMGKQSERSNPKLGSDILEKLDADGGLTG
jgi:hypothetical protein